MSKLVIVESPSKAKTIKKYLGNGYEIVASMGHLRDLPKSSFGIDVDNDFEPKYAGEWFIEQIKTFKSFDKTKIVIISATYDIKSIAENYSVEYIRKSTALNFPDAYNILKN